MVEIGREQVLLQKHRPHRLTGAGGYRSGAEASWRSKKPFTNWRYEPVQCEGCLQTRSFYDFPKYGDLCLYCTGDKKEEEMVDMGLKDWAKKESARVEEQRKGSFPPTWKPPTGTSVVQILDEEARSISGQYGPATVFAVKVKGVAHSWIINEKSPVLRQLITMLSQGVMKLRVTRVGTKMATRYKLEKA